MTEEREIYQGEAEQGENPIKKTSEALKEIGVDVADGTGKMRPLQDILNDVSVAWDRTGEPTREENANQPKDQSREQKREGGKPDYPPRVPSTKNFRRIQKLLFAYPGTNLAIKNLETQLRQIDNELIRSGVANYNIGSGGSISSGDIEVLSGPEADTEKRLRNKKRLTDKINTLRARQEAIRAAVNQLGDAESRIIRTKYFQNWESKNPGARIWRELEMKWDTYLKRLTKALEFVGRFCGEWNDRPVEKAEEKPPEKQPKNAEEVKPETEGGNEKNGQLQP